MSAPAPSSELRAPSSEYERNQVPALLARTEAVAKV